MNSNERNGHTDCVKIRVFILTPVRNVWWRIVIVWLIWMDAFKSALPALFTATLWYLSWRADTPESLRFQKPAAISASADQVPILTWKE